MTAVEALLPSPGERLDLDGSALREWLTERYALPGASWLRVNQVSAIGGQVAGVSGTSEDLTGGIDRVLLGVLRRAADVVLVGAGTLRAEALTHPRNRPLAVVTGSGEVPVDRLPRPAGGHRAMLLCPDAAAARVGRAVGDRAEVVPAGDPMADPGSIPRVLAARGLRRVVCEGGGRLTGALLAAGLVDEFDLTVAPIVVSPGPPAVAGDVPRAPARLVGLLRDDTDRLYARWSLRPA